MHSRFYKLASGLSIALLAGGCVQATRHSNTMVFGTNTSIGLKVGASAASIPEVQIGYARQEAVIMPLVANTRAAAGNYGDDLLNPCDLSSAVDVRDVGKFAVHPCSLVAINGSALDTYSVLASFGAKIKGSGSTGGAEAGIGLAQYFATGMAAQMLALNGGAAVVAVSQAAENSALTQPSPETVKNLYSNPTAFQHGITRADGYDVFRTKLLAKIAATPAGNLGTRIREFETAVISNEDLAQDCPNILACVDAVRANDPYRTDYSTRPTTFDTALEAWNITN